MLSPRCYLVLGLCCQLLAVGSLATTESPVKAMQMSNVEESTVSPLTVMSAAAMDEPHMKTSTERPPVVKSPAAAEEPAMEAKDEPTTPRQALRKTVGDFIIHPLIAFKPRSELDGDDDTPLGKQAPGSTSNSTSPWSLFAFNAGQGFGSSVSSLAGSVSSWLGQRMPVLVETPVRETTTTTTTTTTPRPDIIVRVQHKPSRKPLIAINNQNRPLSLGSNNNLDLDSEEEEEEDEITANRFGNIDDYEEEEEDYVSGEDSAQQQQQPQKKKQKKKQQPKPKPTPAASEEQSSQSDEEPEVTNDVEEDEDDEDIVQRPPASKRQRPLQNQRRRVPLNHNRVQQQRRRVPAGNRRLRPQQYEEVYYEDVEEDDDEFDEQDDDESNDNDRFYYGNKYSSSRRSQSQPNFIQRGQQSLIKQIRQFTRGRTPAEMAAAARKGQKGVSATQSQQRRRQGTLFVNRNGQPVYVAPQLQQPQQQQQYYIQEAGPFPQPPMTTPLKRKGRPTQYITIPWSQLGIQPPTQIVGVAEGLQQQPLIFRMPPNAVAGMQGQRKPSRPMITADAVPLLAEASLMDIFKPPKIPASRSGSKNEQKVTHSRLRPAAPQRIKSGTIVEKAPANSDEQQQMEHQQAEQNSEKQTMNSSNNNEQQFLMVGEDDESAMARQAQAIFGESRYFGRNPIIEALGNGRFAVRKGGRALEQEPEQEQQIPVQIVIDGEQEKQSEAAEKVEVEEVVAPVQPALAAEPIVVPEAMPVASTPTEQQTTA